MGSQDGRSLTRRAALMAGMGVAAGGLVAGWDELSAALNPAVDRAAGGSEPAERRSPVSKRAGWTEGSIGVTSQGREIVRWNTSPSGATRHVMVLSGIHGNEPICVPLAKAFTRAARPDDLQLTIIPTVNPDGWAANTRRNARGVDLNRNYPWRWTRSDGGPGPGSELETQAVMTVLRAERPDLVLWIHQPLAYVAPLLGCPRDYAERWADATGIRVRSTLDQHGGSETWAARGAGLRSLLVEVSSWSTNQSLIDENVRAFEALMPSVTADPNR